MVRRNWSVSARVGLAFAIVILGATFAISFLEFLAFRSMNFVQDTEKIYSPLASTAHDFERNILNARIRFIYHVTIQKPGELEQGRSRYAMAQQNIAEIEAQSQKPGFPSDLQDVARELSTAASRYDVELNKIMNAVQSGVRSGPEYDALVKNWAAAGATLVQTAAKLQSVAEKRSAETEQQATSLLKMVIFLGAVIVICGSATGATCAYLAIRSIRDDLRDAATQLEHGAEQVASAAIQVSASSHSLAEGASRQAALLHDTTVSSQKVDSISKTNSTRAHEANTQTELVSTCITETQQKLEAMLHSMTEIVSSSERISKVVTLIDEIAFQTNILALNAAIEAARAGEQGLGFAVVADEVRNLAQRSAQAARETQTLIDGSIGKSTEGNNRLRDLSSSIETSSERLRQVSSLVREVSHGSQEQTHVLGNVTTAVLEIDRLTQQSAAAAQQTASAGSELEAQSSSMKSLVASLGMLVGGNGNSGAKWARN